ncbi:unnamed protein product [Arabis nemorensis]|uniref:Uncharacterized protein n=1 Tax=Arabis nemorensis TaxID=586526 RepID=A0A565CGZ8_9BRAS|nr:unnamed protein product [Arabis nemorensis]
MKLAVDLKQKNHGQSQIWTLRSYFLRKEADDCLQGEGSTDEEESMRKSTYAISPLKTRFRGDKIG